MGKEMDAVTRKAYLPDQLIALEDENGVFDFVNINQATWFKLALRFPNLGADGVLRCIFVFEYSLDMQFTSDAGYHRAVGPGMFAQQTKTVYARTLELCFTDTASFFESQEAFEQARDTLEKGSDRESIRLIPGPEAGLAFTLGLNEDPNGGITRNPIRIVEIDGWGWKPQQKYTSKVKMLSKQKRPASWNATPTQASEYNFDETGFESLGGDLADLLSQI